MSFIFDGLHYDGDCDDDADDDDDTDDGDGTVSEC